MVRIRLTRIGRKNAPAYRVVVTDKKSKVNGKFIEIIGNYNPTEDPKKITYIIDRYKYWTSVGAKPSDAIVKLIKGTYKFEHYDPKGKRATKIAKSERKEKSIETVQEPIVEENK